MSAMANIVAFDGASTPVLHILIPVSVTREKETVTAEWRENLSGLPVEAQVRCTSKLQRLSSGIMRTLTRVEIPVMEAIGAQNAAGYTAAPKVAYTDTFDFVSYASPRSTTTGRRLGRQLAINIAGSVSASVVPTTTGPVPELCDLLIMPT